MEIRALSSHEELREAFGPASEVFGWQPSDEDFEHQRALVDPERFLVALDGSEVIGSAEALPFELTVPGGHVPVAGVTTVAVKPTHRRRGVMSGLIRRQFEDFHERGEPLAALWASEGSIYGRFGYGLATFSCEISVAREHLRLPLAPANAEARLVDVEDALAAIPPIYEQVRARTPGMLTRTSAWWEHKVLVKPEYGRAEGGSLRRVVLAIGGRDQAYAIYRLNLSFAEGVPTSRLNVYEALSLTPVAMVELWRWLAGIDLVATIHSRRLPVDHPLVLAVSELARLRMRIGDGLWLRLVDVEAALEARRLRGDGEVVIEVADEQCPWNEGRWRIANDEVGRTGAEPELRLTAAELASVYLGGFTFDQLAAAGRAEELVPGALERADALFRTNRAPWCPEVF